MILQEPLDEKEIQALHTAFHTIQAEVERLRHFEGRAFTAEAEVERLREEK